LNHPLAKLILPKIAEKLGISIEDIEEFLGGTKINKKQKDIYQEWR
jgi:hypothetical protein